MEWATTGDDPERERQEAELAKKRGRPGKAGPVNWDQLPFRPRTCAQSAFTTSGLEARSGFGVIIMLRPTD